MRFMPVGYSANDVSLKTLGIMSFIILYSLRLKDNVPDDSGLNLMDDVPDC